MTIDDVKSCVLRICKLFETRMGQKIKIYMHVTFLHHNEKKMYTDKKNYYSVLSFISRQELRKKMQHSKQTCMMRMERVSEKTFSEHNFKKIV